MVKVANPEERKNNEDFYQKKEDQINQEGMIPASPQPIENPSTPDFDYNQSTDYLNDAPSPNQQDVMPSQPPQMSSDEIQEVAESIVEEKWEELTSKLGNINLWKETTDRDIASIKQEILRTQDHFNNLQRALMGKVNEYSDNITKVNSEMKALEKVLQKIIEPLTTNVKELNKITDKLKNKK